MAASAGAVRCFEDVVGIGGQESDRYRPGVVVRHARHSARYAVHSLNRCIDIDVGGFTAAAKIDERCAIRI